MYEFHCKYIKNKFESKFLFTDRDSLVYEIKTEYVYEDFYSDKDLFDFSDYPLGSKFFDPVNKKIIGKMKDEFKGKIISEFASLKSKMYSLISEDDEEVTQAKGVNKKIRHKEFVSVLFNKKVMRHNMKRIHRKEFIVNCIESELMMFVRSHCLVLMIKDMHYMIVSILWFIFIKT